MKKLFTAICQSNVPGDPYIHVYRLEKLLSYAVYREIEEVELYCRGRVKATA
jgi:hypothetical protein